MIELVKQGKQKEALDFFSTQKGALILNEYYELNNYSGSIAWWGMPTEAYALCQIVPHVTEKGYSSIFEFFSNTQNFCVN